MTEKSGGVSLSRWHFGEKIERIAEKEARVNEVFTALIKRRREWYVRTHHKHGNKIPENTLKGWRRNLDFASGVLQKSLAKRSDY